MKGILVGRGGLVVAYVTAGGYYEWVIYAGTCLEMKNNRMEMQRKTRDLYLDTLKVFLYFLIYFSFIFLLF